MLFHRIKAFIRPNSKCVIRDLSSKKLHNETVIVFIVREAEKSDGKTYN